MNFKLFLLSIWIPKYFLKKELNHLAEITLNQLDNLLKIHCPTTYQQITKLKFPLNGNLEEIRLKMAQAHNIRVNALSNVLGPEETVQIARPLMFKTGYELGLDIKTRLGLKEDLNDLIKAAHILYQVLGIDFEFHEGDGCTPPNLKSCIIINRCSLAHYYLPLTCQVLSGADEGVVSGLNSQVEMIFKEKITEGASACIAAIELKNEDNNNNNNNNRKSLK
jgi:hypothetical protein